MTKLFRTVSVKDTEECKGRLPDIEGYYLTDWGKAELSKGNWYDPSCDCSPLDMSVEYWLEEVELPSDEEIIRCSCPDLEPEKEGWMRGVKWLKQLILKK